MGHPQKLLLFSCFEFGPGSGFHGAQYKMPNGVVLIASYHPSNQNTATGKLTEKMFREVFDKAKKVISR